MGKRKAKEYNKKRGQVGVALLYSTLQVGHGVKF